MTLLITIFFGIAWIVVGFIALRWIGQRFFHEPRRAAVFAASVVVAFAVGTAWPFSGLRGGAPTAPAAPPVAPVAVAPGRDVGQICQSAHLVDAKALGSLDVVGDVIAGKPEQRPDAFVIDRAGTLLVSGWVADVDGKTAATAACLVIDGKIDPHASAIYGVARPDVGAAYKTDALVPTGYSLTLPVRDLPRGVHRVTVAVVPSSGVTAALLSKATFRVP